MCFGRDMRYTIKELSIAEQEEISSHRNKRTFPLLSEYAEFLQHQWAPQNRATRHIANA